MRPLSILLMLIALVAATASGEPATTLKGTGMRYNEIPEFALLT